MAACTSPKRRTAWSGGSPPTGGPSALPAPRRSGGRSSGDGGLAVDAGLSHPEGLTCGPDGSLLIADRNNHAVRQVDSRGIITTVAGTGEPGYNGIGRPATQTQLAEPRAVALQPDGYMLISEGRNHRVRRLATPQAGQIALGQEIRVASEDGGAVHVFNGNGRHLRTENARTGTILLTFGYNTEDELVSITDAFANVTTVQRDGSGSPTAIVAPFGQQTDLTPDPNGYLESITNPAGEAVQFTYQPDGLLKTLTDPKNEVYTFSWDGLGRVEKDQDPLGGFSMLARTELDPGAGVESGFEVTKSSQMGRNDCLPHRSADDRREADHGDRPGGPGFRQSRRHRRQPHGHLSRRHGRRDDRGTRPPFRHGAAAGA